MLTRAVIDGLLAQRKMDGDSDVFAPDDWRHLDAIIQQGKRAEARLRELGYEKQIEGAYKSGGVKYESPK
ncbi:MAG: hypothetical protein FJ012_11165 [Chloroflexi bacterium]|nr:hypothetical protein [Chloroflexota bacterium]